MISNLIGRAIDAADEWLDEDVSWSVFATTIVGVIFTGCIVGVVAAAAINRSLS